LKPVFTKFCDLIGGVLYLANDVWEFAFDFTKSVTAVEFILFYFISISVLLTLYKILFGWIEVVTLDFPYAYLLHRYLRMQANVDSEHPNGMAAWEA
jgi:hypothetical protein